MDFEEHLASRRAALSAAEAEDEERQIEEAKRRDRGMAAMRRMTAEFSHRADAIGFLPRTVVKFRTGEWGKCFFSEVLGEGWVVTDRDPRRQSEYGQPYTRYVILRDGRWISCGSTGSSIIDKFESTEAASSKGYRFGETRPYEVHELPPGFPCKGAIGFIRPEWVTGIHSEEETQALLIDELLLAERS